MQTPSPRQRLGHGVYRDGSDSDLGATLAAWSPHLPGGAMFTGLTACQIWGLWLPPMSSDRPLDVAVPVDSRGSGQRGLSVQRVTDVPAAWRWNNIPVAPVTEAILGATRHAGVLDLVVLIDSALHAGDTTIDELEAKARSRRRGAARLRRAIALSDGRSESTWETLLRTLHATAGIGVTPQTEIPTAAGRFRADLLINGTRTLQEFDGAGHFERATYRRDRRRDAALAEAGYVRHGWTAPDVAHEPDEIVAVADRATGRPEGERNLRAWHQLWSESLFGKEKWRQTG